MKIKSNEDPCSKRSSFILCQEGNEATVSPSHGFGSGYFNCGTELKFDIVLVPCFLPIRSRLESILFIQFARIQFPIFLHAPVRSKQILSFRRSDERQREQRSYSSMHKDEYPVKTPTSAALRTPSTLTSHPRNAPWSGEICIWAFLHSTWTAQRTI